MQKRKMTAGVAAAGVLAGTAGLVWLAMPAGADPSPSLPEISPEALVESVIEADSPALAGTLGMENNLGLPVAELMGPIPSSARVFLDGTGKYRVDLTQPGNEQSFVNDGETAWEWDASSQTALHLPAGKQLDPASDKDVPAGDPSEWSRNLVEQIREVSSVTIDGTASVADRDAYELALAPKPDERTLLREVRVAVDAETRTPLRVTVLANGSSDPVLEFGFTDIEFGAPDSDRFTFTPPEGATVRDGMEPARPQEDVSPDGTTDEEYVETPSEEIRESTTEVVGDGWDSVLVATGDEFTMSPDEVTEGSDTISSDMLNEMSEPIEGDWGSGRVFSTSVLTAIITDDGRIAVGAVPAQVLTDALSEQ